MKADYLFVYGTLRIGFDGPMAHRLHRDAQHMGPAWARGTLWQVADYPGFVPGDGGMVAGDLFALADPAATLRWMDNYEECADHFLEPREYRRTWISVERPDGPVQAWTYIYARPTAGLGRIGSGDFLSPE